MSQPISMTGSQLFITICSHCDRIKLHDHWLEIEEAESYLGNLAAQELKISHGICGDCFEKALQDNR